MRLISVLGAIGLCTLPALAGYTVTTGVNNVQTPAGAQPGAQPGDLFFTTVPGTFSAYLADGPTDPQIAFNDLPNYRYSLNGSVASVTGALQNIIQYTGTYRIFYDINLDGVEDVLVSAGNFDITATFGIGAATLAGSLMQTQAGGPPFADLSYGGNPVLYTGTYVETNPGVSGTIEGVLRQPVPAPASLALLGLAGLVARRRRA